MKMVIELPEKLNNKSFTYLTEEEKQTILNAVDNGTPLPKGHGRLKDATTLKKMFEDKEGDDFTAFHFYDAIEECPTIIEADKEGAEE